MSGKTKILILTYNYYSMDWTNIIIAVISALGGGGLAVLFTRKETKEGMSLDNMQKVISTKDKIIDEQKAHYEALLAEQKAHYEVLLAQKDRIIEEREERCKELKEDLDKKDAKIDELHKMNATLRHRLDDANTKAAVAETMRCDITKCTNRRPPFGSNHRVAEDFIETKTEN